MEPSPPQFTPLPTAVIQDKTMPPALFACYARLYAAAWRNDYRCTDPLHFEAELLPLLGVRRSQARQHLRLLRFAGLLDWTTQQDNRYTIRFPAAPAAMPAAGKTDCVVVGESSLLESRDSQQQHTQSDKPLFQTAASEDEVYTQALGYLGRAGVWPEVAERLAGQVARNQRSGDESLPGLTDVLGWIAYCFADREKNKIGLPAAVLAANLGANRLCPDEYRPPPLCANCRSEVDYCDCEGEPAPHFPPHFLEYAFRRQYQSFNLDRWGVCTYCHASPCQCHR
jgi:hypothetical protein